MLRLFLISKMAGASTTVAFIFLWSSVTRLWLFLERFYAHISRAFFNNASVIEQSYCCWILQHGMNSAKLHVSDILLSRVSCWLMVSLYSSISRRGQKNFCEFHQGVTWIHCRISWCILSNVFTLCFLFITLKNPYSLHQPQTIILLVAFTLLTLKNSSIKHNSCNFISCCFIPL